MSKKPKTIWVDEASDNQYLYQPKLNKLTIAILTAIYSGAYYEHVSRK